jgi:hypothetical protein
MIIGRQRHAVLLAVNTHQGKPVDPELVEEARRSGLARVDLESILDGDVPRERELAVVIAASWLIVDRAGQLDETDLAELESVGLGPMALADLAALAMGTAV